MPATADTNGGVIVVARILIVEDEPDLRFIIKLIFERAGHEVVEARNGADALQRVRAGPPDLVITDVMMPVMNGLELIGHLRSNPQTATIPILAVSSHVEIAAADAALEKPFEPQQLLEAATSLLVRSEG